PSQRRALDARPWTSTKGAAARSPTRTSTYSSTPGATTMRRSTTFAADDPFGSVMAPILASLATGRGATLARGADRADSYRIELARRRCPMREARMAAGSIDGLAGVLIWTEADRFPAMA